MSYDALQARAYDAAFGEHPSIALTVERSRIEPADRVLDVGCGSGHSTRLVAERGATVIGIDPSPAMLALARDRLGEGARLLSGCCEALPVPAESASVLLLINSVHHLDDLETAMTECRRALRADGRLVASWEDAEDTIEPSRVVEAARGAGFTHVHLERVVPAAGEPLWILEVTAPATPR